LLAEGKNHDVTEKLGRAIDDYTNSDPLDRHRFTIDKDELPSPITLRDEKTIIADFRDDSNFFHEQKVNAIDPNLTVIVGSKALGLERLTETLPSMAPSQIRSSSNQSNLYKSYEKNINEYKDAKAFEEKLLIPLMSTQIKKSPYMVFLRVDASSSISQLLAIIDVCNKALSSTFELDNSLRIFFLLDPAAYWCWLTNAKHTLAREPQQPFIMLSTWKKEAVRSLLERIGVDDTSEAASSLTRDSEGWYLSLEIFCKLKKDNPKWRQYEQFKSKYIPLDKIVAKDSEIFLQSTGLYDHPYANKVIQRLLREYGENEFDAEVIYLCTEEVTDISNSAGIDLFIRWLIGMNLITRAARDVSSSLKYRIPKSISNALKATDVP